MKSFNLQTLATAMNGTLLRPGDGELMVFSGVSTDTRSLAEGALFFALCGENFDAHDFLERAEKAVAFVVSDKAKVPPQRPAIVVSDPLAALQELAKWYCAELDILVVAITGSNGKTSTKDFTYSVLSQKFCVNATLGNLNNHLGLPLTVLATRPGHEVGIFEMGMNHPGELASLCHIAPPDVSVITNVGTAHIENLGSREAIAEEKGTVARALKKEGKLVVPCDCDFLPLYCEISAGEMIPVGKDQDIRAENIITRVDGSSFDLVIEGLGTITTSIPVTGKHMIDNALLAAGVGQTLGLSLEEIAAGLSKAELASGRLRQFSYQGIQVIDDTYNANPESVAAALRTLAALPCEGKRVASLGVMAELGEYAQEAYQKTGRLASELGLHLVVVGEDARAMSQAAVGASFFADIEEAAAHLKTAASSGDLILFKGSRAAAMERVMQTAFPEIN